MSPERSWKKFERRTAKALGGRRVPFSGGLVAESGLPKSDVMNVPGFVFIECKHRATWTVQTWIRELQEKARLGQPWLLVLGTPKVRGHFAVLPLEHLAKMVLEAGEDRDGLSQSQGAPSPGGAGETAPPRP